MTTKQEFQPPQIYGNFIRTGFNEIARIENGKLGNQRYFYTKEGVGYTNGTLGYDKVLLYTGDIQDPVPVALSALLGMEVYNSVCPPPSVKSKLLAAVAALTNEIEKLED